MRYYETIDELLKLKKFNSIIFDDKLKCSFEFELLKIIKIYSRKELNNRLQNIYNFIYYNVDNLISWVDRLKIIQNKLKNDSSSLYSHIIRYGDIEGEKKFNQKNIKCSQTLEKYVNMYGEIGHEMWRKKYENNGHSLNKYILKYGSEIGCVKWNNYINKRKLTYLKNKNFGKKYRNGRTLDEYIDNYGVEMGSELYNKRNLEQSYRFSKKYYINKYGDEQGKIMWDEYRKSMKKTSKISFIERYGEELGIIKYDELIKKKIYQNSLDYYIVKYGDEQGKIMWDEYRNKTIFKVQKYSKISQELFWCIYENINDNLKKICKFAELNFEWFIRDNKTIYFFDFVIGNIVIEFDGSYWHSLEKTIKNDRIKENVLLNSKYKLLRIPEKSYLDNKEDIILMCLNFIKENYERKC